jgi:predicted regulator of Ras-like GTPase activity (Roadblock/LC7/MglB family)
MEKKSKVEELTALLEDLKVNTPDIEASAVTSKDGFMIAAVLPQDTEKDRVALMLAAMHLLGERTTTELERGTLSEVHVRGKNGHVVLIASEDGAFLTALARKGADLTGVYPGMKRAAAQITRIMQGA